MNELRRQLGSIERLLGELRSELAGAKREGERLFGLVEQHFADDRAAIAAIEARLNLLERQLAVAAGISAAQKRWGAALITLLGAVSALIGALVNHFLTGGGRPPASL